MEFLGIRCDEMRGQRNVPYKARLCILKIFAEMGPCLSFKELYKQYKLGGKGYLRNVIRYLEDKGFIRRVVDASGEERFCLTAKGGVIAFLDPPCPDLFLAGADVALQVAYEAGVRVNWLLSAGRYWRSGVFRGFERDFWYARRVAELLFLDSGAQQFYRRFRGFSYPYTARQYLDFAELLGVDLIATLDLPLDILTPRGLSVSEGVRRTVELGVEVISEAERRGLLHKVVPVLQGYNSPSQWLECLDLYKQHGVTPQRFKLWGVGSLCMAKSSNLTYTVLLELKKALGDAGIHVFGINLKHLRKAFNLINSYDTSAWVYWAKIDGAVLVWSSRRRAFVHLQARTDHRYDTRTLLDINLRQVITMHEWLCKQLVDNHNANNNLYFTRAPSF